MRVTPGLIGGTGVMLGTGESPGIEPRMLGIVVGNGVFGIVEDGGITRLGGAVGRPDGSGGVPVEFGGGEGNPFVRGADGTAGATLGMLLPGNGFTVPICGAIDGVDGCDGNKPVCGGGEFFHSAFGVAGLAGQL